MELGEDFISMARAYLPHVVVLSHESGATRILEIMDFLNSLSQDAFPTFLSGNSYNGGVWTGIDTGEYTFLFRDENTAIQFKLLFG